MLKFSKKYILFKSREYELSYNHINLFQEAIFKYYLKKKIIILPCEPSSIEYTDELRNSGLIDNIHCNYDIISDSGNNLFSNFTELNKLVDSKTKLFMVDRDFEIPAKYRKQCQCIEYSVDGVEYGITKFMLYENWSKIGTLNISEDYDINTDILKIHRKQTIKNALKRG